MRDSCRMVLLHLKVILVKILRDNLILADTFPSCEKSSFRDKVFIQGIYWDSSKLNNCVMLNVSGVREIPALSENSLLFRKPGVQTLLMFTIYH
jgi:hypothetical protein